MEITTNTIMILVGLAINLITLVGYSNKHERRLTKIETVVGILARKAGLNGPADILHRED